jgi:hypothetical protein
MFPTPVTGKLKQVAVAPLSGMDPPVPLNVCALRELKKNSNKIVEKNFTTVSEALQRHLNFKIIQVTDCSCVLNSADIGLSNVSCKLAYYSVCLLAL